jgi:hypothetical protein
MDNERRWWWVVQNNQVRLADLMKDAPQDEREIFQGMHTRPEATLSGLHGRFSNVTTSELDTRLRGWLALGCFLARSDESIRMALKEVNAQVKLCQVVADRLGEISAIGNQALVLLSVLTQHEDAVPWADGRESLQEAIQTLRQQERLLQSTDQSKALETCQYLLEAALALDESSEWLRQADDMWWTYRETRSVNKSRVEEWFTHVDQIDRARLILEKDPPVLMTVGDRMIQHARYRERWLNEFLGE